MIQIENDARTYHYAWYRWLMPIGIGLTTGAMGAIAVVLADFNPSMVWFVTAIAVLAVLVNAVPMLREPREFVLRERALHIRWLRQHDVVPTQRVVVVTPSDDSRIFVFRYEGRTIRVNTNLGQFHDFRSNLLLRGAQIDTASGLRDAGKTA